ncbi:UNVERIFIED_CONTAM: hypothetical protein K2H54_071832 [Gekko kuhli]
MPSMCLECYPGPLASRKQAGNLLEALERNEQSCGETAEKDGLPGEERAHRLSTLSLLHEKKLIDGQKGGRKKIKIVSNPPWQASYMGEPQKTRSASFIAGVKRSLSQLNFDRFSQTLQHYKKTNDFDAMLSQMSALFAEDPEKHALLREFYQFVRPQHKKQYDEACRRQTGVGCGYKPEHSLPREERLQLAENSGKECEIKVTFSEGSSGQLNSEQHLNKGGSHLTSGSDVAGGSSAAATALSNPPGKASSSLKESQNERIRAAYLSELRTALDKSSLNSFFSAASAYKKTDDYDAVASTVAALFTEKPENFHLLQSK